MRLQFEKVEPEAGSSFRVVHLTQAETCRVFWHYHPEHEIVFIPEGSGRRHVGQHISRYDGGELVFIGPNVPHLNFSYGKDGPYEEVVVQLRDDFLGHDFLKKAELQAIARLFERARLGLAFGPATKRRVGPALLQLPHQTGFARLLTLLNIVQTLATAPDADILHTDGPRFELNHREQDRINRIYQFVETNYAAPIDIRTVADLANLTIPAFSRYFKRMTHLTFTEFVNEYRVSQARRLLHSARTVADVGTAVGFNNMSHFNKTFKTIAGQTPSGYREQIKILNYS